MAGRILVVDDLEPNRRLLQVRLEAEYYEVILASDGEEALRSVRADPPDLILLDVMMPGMDGLMVCRELKADPATTHIPVVIVTALDQQEDRVAGLQAGADEFLTKPVDDLALFARVRNLLRLKAVMDELRQRQESGRALGAIDDERDVARLTNGAKILIVDDPGRASERLARRLGSEHRPRLETDPRAAAHAAQADWDLVIIDLAALTFDGMRLAARLLSDDATRNMPILAVVDPDDRVRMAKALDIGVNDLLSRPIDTHELAARVNTLVKRKRYADYLRATLDQSLEMAVTDQLTGLHNRRFMSSQLRELIRSAEADSGALAVMITDIDHFKKINDNFGHDAGDAVLKEFAARLASNVRAVDTACRFGGEEFVVMMPGADVEDARLAAERLRETVRSSAFYARAGDVEIAATVSVGVAVFEAGDDADTLIKRADQALYAAKTGGRDRVMVAGPRKEAA